MSGIYIKNIGGIELSQNSSGTTRPMWIVEEHQSQDVIATAVGTVDGGVFTYKKVVKNTSKLLTLTTGEMDWQTREVVDAIIALANNPSTDIVTLTDYQDNQFDAVFRYEQSGGAVQFRQVVPNFNWNYFRGQIYMRRV